ncbi:MAG: hypothetical protein QOH21_717 [Acidobacteriota bacterium]|jgi:hypothetical protein|nr:hypothetical protein [Acidobacteriota bacterium]
MSGFLGRMVARARTPDRALRPRVHSVYEAVPQTTFDEVMWDPPAREVRAENTFAAGERVIASVALPPVSGGVLPAAHRQSDPIEPPRITPSSRVEPRGIDVPHAEQEAHGEMPQHSAEATAPAPPPTIIERDVLLPPEVRTLVRTRRGADRIERLRMRSERTTIEREFISEGPVEITIGRIDVRAVIDTAREAPRATCEPAPTMSLRDYLAQRDARRRR